MAAFGDRGGTGYSFGGKKAEEIKQRIRKLRDTQRLNDFAEFLANGYTPTQAARCLGCDRHYGNAMLQRIRKQLGRQAV